MAATWKAVFDFPSCPAAMTTPSLIAMVRRPVTMNSRAMTTMTTHAATRPRWTSMHERRHHDELVGERVEELPDDRDEPLLPRHPPVEEVGRAGHRVDDRRDEAVHARLVVREPEEHRDHRDPHERDRVRRVQELPPERALHASPPRTSAPTLAAGSARTRPSPASSTATTTGSAGSSSSAHTRGVSAPIQPTSAASGILSGACGTTSTDDGLADRREQEAPAPAQVDEVQLGGDRGRHAPVLERDAILEPEQDLLAQVRRVRPEVERAEAAPLRCGRGATPSPETRCMRVAPSPKGFSVARPRKRFISPAIVDPALRREQAVEPDAHLAVDRDARAPRRRRRRPRRARAVRAAPPPMRRARRRRRRDVVRDGSGGGCGAARARAALLDSAADVASACA